MTETITQKQIDRFHSKYVRGGPDECWLWLDKPNAGYGRMCLGRGETILAHRLAYIIEHGELDDDIDVPHSCGTNLCMNPAHLYTGGDSENMLDAVRHGTHNMASKTHCPQGHEYNAYNTYVYKNGARCCRVCQRRPRKKGVLQP